MSVIILISNDQESQTLCEEISSAADADYMHYPANEYGVKFVCDSSWDLVFIDAAGTVEYAMQTCELIRQCQPLCQIFVILASSDQSTTTKFLIKGADDVITSPINKLELLGRVSSALRRSNCIKEQFRTDHLPVISSARDSIALYSVPTTDKQATEDAEKFQYVYAGDICLCKLKQEVTKAGQQIPLTHTEYKLFSYLVDHSHRPCSKTELLDNVLGYHDDSYTASLHSHISRLRRKLDLAESKTTSIETLWRYGYRFLSDTAQDTTQHQSA